MKYNPPSRHDAPEELRSTTDSRSAPQSAEVPLLFGGAESRPVLAFEELRSTTDSRPAPQSAEVPLLLGGAESRPVLASEWGSFALVTYLPDPLGSFLTQLRKLLPGDHADAHITFLPPRRLSVPIDCAAEAIDRKLSTVPAFELELGQVKVFSQTNMLYLSVEAGNQQLLDLHRSLNDGDIFAEEPFEYIPHLTLGGPLHPAHVTDVCEQAAQAWNDSAIDRSFKVHEAVLLWQPGLACSGKEWKRLSSYTLAANPNFDAHPVGNEVETR